MDKNTKVNAKLERTPRTIPLPEGIRDIHRDYGLWIFKTLRKVSFEPRRELHPRAFKFYSLSHLIEGDGWYWSKASGTVARFEAGQGVLAVPDGVHFYSGRTAPYVEDAVCFSGPVADHLHRCGVVREGILSVGRGRKLLPVLELAADPSRDSQIKANAALLALLTELYLRNRGQEANSHASRVEELLAAVNADLERDWSLDEMAEFCNLSVNQFRRIFHAETGLNPKEYADTVKVNKAAELLCREAVTVREVSAQLGYADQYHFSRRFKALKGLSPQNYRDSVILGRRRVSPPSGH